MQALQKLPEIPSYEVRPGKEKPVIQAKEGNAWPVDDEQIKTQGGLEDSGDEEYDSDSPTYSRVGMMADTMGYTGKPSPPKAPVAVSQVQASGPQRGMIADTVEAQRGVWHSHDEEQRVNPSP